MLIYLNHQVTPINIWFKWFIEPTCNSYDVFQIIYNNVLIKRLLKYIQNRIQLCSWAAFLPFYLQNRSVSTITRVTFYRWVGGKVVQFFISSSSISSIGPGVMFWCPWLVRFYSHLPWLGPVQIKSSQVSSSSLVVMDVMAGVVHHHGGLLTKQTVTGVAAGWLLDLTVHMFTPPRLIIFTKHKVSISEAFQQKIHTFYFFEGFLTYTYIYYWISKQKFWWNEKVLIIIEFLP